MKTVALTTFLPLPLPLAPFLLSFSFPLPPSSFPFFQTKSDTEPRAYCKQGVSPVKGWGPRTLPPGPLWPPAVVWGNSLQIHRVPQHTGLQSCWRKLCARDFPWLTAPSASHQGGAGLGRSPACVSLLPPPSHPAQQKWARALWGPREQKKTYACPEWLPATGLACGLSFSFFFQD